MKMNNDLLFVWACILLQIPRRPKDVGFLEFYTRWLLGPQGDVTLFLGPSSCLHVSYGSPRCILQYYIRDE